MPHFGTTFTLCSRPLLSRE